MAAARNGGIGFGWQVADRVRRRGERGRRLLGVPPLAVDRARVARDSCPSQPFRSAGAILARVTTPTVDAEPACPALDSTRPADARRSRRSAVRGRARRPARRHSPAFDEHPAGHAGTTSRRATPWATPFSQWAFHRSWWDAYGATAHEQTLVVVDPADRDGGARPSRIVPLMHRHEVEPIDADDAHDDAPRRRQPADAGRADREGRLLRRHLPRRLRDGPRRPGRPARRRRRPRRLPRRRGRRPDRSADAGPWDVVDLRRLRCGDPAADALRGRVRARRADVRLVGHAPSARTSARWSRCRRACDFEDVPRHARQEGAPRDPAQDPARRGRRRGGASRRRRRRSPTSTTSSSCTRSAGAPKGCSRDAGRRLQPALLPPPVPPFRARRAAAADAPDRRRPARRAAASTSTTASGSSTTTPASTRTRATSRRACVMVAQYLEQAIARRPAASSTSCAATSPTSTSGAPSIEPIQRILVTRADAARVTAGMTLLVAGPGGRSSRPSRCPASRRSRVGRARSGAGQGRRGPRDRRQRRRAGASLFAGVRRSTGRDTTSASCRCRPGPASAASSGRASPRWSSTSRTTRSRSARSPRTWRGSSPTSSTTTCTARKSSARRRRWRCRRPGYPRPYVVSTVHSSRVRSAEDRAELREPHAVDGSAHRRLEGDRPEDRRRGPRRRAGLADLQRRRPRALRPPGAVLHAPRGVRHGARLADRGRRRPPRAREGPRDAARGVAAGAALLPGRVSAHRRRGQPLRRAARPGRRAADRATASSSPVAARTCRPSPRPWTSPCCRPTARRRA